MHISESALEVKHLSTSQLTDAIEVLEEQIYWNDDNKNYALVFALEAGKTFLLNEIAQRGFK
jgi:hypothetical protein